MASESLNALRIGIIESWRRSSAARRRIGCCHDGVSVVSGVAAISPEAGEVIWRGGGNIVQ